MARLDVMFLCSKGENGQTGADRSCEVVSALGFRYNLVVARIVASIALFAIV